MSGYVYVAHAQDRSVIKVGYSVNPKLRIAQLRVGRKPMVFVGCMPGTLADEAAITSRFRQSQALGPCGGMTTDWFYWSDEIMSELNKLPLSPEMPPIQCKSPYWNKPRQKPAVKKRKGES